MPPSFIKFHGFGNDYIVIESDALAGVGELGEFARRICDRHYGAGSDGIAIVGSSDDQAADFRVRIFNPDGSEANLSGNGTRCAAAYLHYRSIWSKTELRLITRSGVKLYTLIDADPRGRYLFDSELGQPKFDSASIPMTTDGLRDRVVDYPLEVDGERVLVTALQMGNPITCIFTKDFESFDWRRIGKNLENHKQFPERTNVVFVRVDDQKSISLRIWERGVGETMASGTCSCGGAVAAMVKEGTDRNLDVFMEGGQAKIKWRDDGEVVLRGAAEVIYAGDWLAQT